MKMTDETFSLENLYSVPSDKLRELKDFIQKLPEIQNAFGDVFEFRLVVDTSIILADLKWLATHRRDALTRTSLLEVIDAGTADVYAPPKLIEEIDRHLPNIASRHGIRIELLLAEWAKYRERLKFLDPNPHFVERHSNSIDPADAEFIALAEEIKAHGIISKDKHITQMGGNKLTLDFVLEVRSYSREIAVELNIEIMGFTFGILTLTMGAAFLELAKGLKTIIADLPGWIKLLLITSAFYIMIHPASREKICNWYKSCVSTVWEVGPVVMEHLDNAAKFVQQRRNFASDHLTKIKSKIVIHHSVQKKPNRKRKRIIKKT